MGEGIGFVWGGGLVQEHEHLDYNKWLGMRGEKNNGGLAQEHEHLDYNKCLGMRGEKDNGGLNKEYEYFNYKKRQQIVSF